MHNWRRRKDGPQGIQGHNMLTGSYPNSGNARRFASFHPRSRVRSSYRHQQCLSKTDHGNGARSR
eukprot:2098666-Pyramimonas_sp.AAC.1